MFAPALVHIEYLLSDRPSDKPSDKPDGPTPEGGAKPAFRERSTHAIYIPLNKLSPDGDHVTSDQLHLELTVNLTDETESLRDVIQQEKTRRLWQHDVRQAAKRLTVSVTPKVPLKVTQLRILLSGEIMTFKRGLFNGYQSWTTTNEVSLNSAQRGLVGTPQRVINKWVLDSSGDYRFVKYANTKGRLHGWSFAYFTRPGAVAFVGGLAERHGMTLLTFEAGEGLNVLPEPPLTELPVDSETRLADIALVTVRDPAAHSDENVAPMRDVASADVADCAFALWFELQRRENPDLALPRRNEMLTGYTSWYRHYEDITEDKLLRDLESATRAFGKLDASGFRKLFQIDDGYSKKGDWLELYADRFPNGLKPLADAIEQAGFTPGLWMAPFVCERESNVFKTHKDWLLLDASGNHVRTGSHWSGHVALDTQNPEVRAWVTKCLQTATREWGFKMLKLDFLYAACMVPHAGLNRGQLMADAIKLCRDAVGDDIIIDGCGVPLASTFGMFDFCRVGCDVGLDWNGPVWLHITDRERVSTLHSLGNTIYRAGLDGRAFGCDPDVVLMRPDVDYTDEQRAMVIDGAALHASMMLTSDDMDAWTSSQTGQFQEALDIMRLRQNARVR